MVKNWSLDRVQKKIFKFFNSIKILITVGGWRMRFYTVKREVTQNKFTKVTSTS